MKKSYLILVSLILIISIISISNLASSKVMSPEDFAKWEKKAQERGSKPTVTTPANNYLKNFFGINQDSTKNGYFGNAAAGMIDAIIPRTQRDFAGLITGGAQPGGLGVMKVGPAVSATAKPGFLSGLGSRLSGLFKSSAPAAEGKAASIAEGKMIGKPSVNKEFGSSGKITTSPNNAPYKPTGNANIDSAVEAATQRVNAAKESLKTAKGLELDAANQELYSAQKELTNTRTQAKNYADLTKQEDLLYELDILRGEKSNLKEQTSTPARDAQMAKIDKRIDDIARTTPDREGKLGELATIEQRINERNPTLRGKPGSTPEAINEVLNGAQTRNAPAPQDALAAAKKETSDAMRTMMKSDPESAEYKAAEAKWLEAVKRVKELDSGTNPYLIPAEKGTPLLDEGGNGMVVGGKTLMEPVDPLTLTRVDNPKVMAGVAAGGAALASTKKAQAGESDPALKAARIMTGRAIFGYGR